MSSNVLQTTPAVKMEVAGLLRDWSDDFAPYLHDESKMSGHSAKSLASPKNIAELSALLSYLNGKGQRVRISAARTGLTGGAVPEADEVVISLEKLRASISTPKVNAQGEYEVTALAGMSLREVADSIRENLPGYFFPVDPTEQSASIGGAASLNAGGARSLHFGSMQNWIAGIRVILSNGEELNLRRGQYAADNYKFILRSLEGERTLTAGAIPKPETKNTLGYFFDKSVDAVDLFIGSEGTLGVIAEVTLRLTELPKISLSHFQAFQSTEAALTAVEKIRKLNGTLAVEFIDHRSIKKLQEVNRADLFRFLDLTREAGAALFIEAGLSSDDEVLAYSESLFEILSELDEDPELSISGTNLKTLADIKSFRHAVPERMNAIIASKRAEIPGIHKLATDMAVKDADLHWVYNLYESELSKRGFEFCIFGHAGSNHFHVNILPRSLEELKLAKAAYLELAKAVAERGGAVAAEHGIGKLKREFLRAQYSEEVLANFRKLKEFFDPKGILNSGVL